MILSLSVHILITHIDSFLIPKTNVTMNQQTLPQKQYHERVVNVFIQVYLRVFLCVCALSVMLVTSWQMGKQSFFLFGLFSNASSRLVFPFCSCFFALCSAESPEFPGQPSWLITQFPKTATSDVYSVKTSHSFFMDVDECHFMSPISTAQRFTEKESEERSLPVKMLKSKIHPQKEFW